jgi:hypothetical protein
VKHAPKEKRQMQGQAVLFKYIYIEETALIHTKKALPEVIPAVLNVRIIHLPR